MLDKFCRIKRVKFPYCLKISGLFLTTTFES
jgi:hypothetical protein